MQEIVASQEVEGGAAAADPGELERDGDFLVVCLRRRTAGKEFDFVWGLASPKRPRRAAPFGSTTNEKTQKYELGFHVSLFLLPI